jgi:hypothetical protein
MLAAELQGLHVDWSPHRCWQEAELELRRRDSNPYFADELLSVAPQLYLPHRSTVAPEVEARTWFEHPAMRWVIGEACAGGNGRPAERDPLFAGLAHMASSSRPDMKLSLREIAHSTSWSWAYSIPSSRAASSACYDTLHAMTRRHAAGMCIHANLALVLELAGLTMSRGGAKYTNPLRDVAVDGTLIAANVPQHAPPGRSPRERKTAERRIAGPHRPMAQYVVYKGGRIVFDATSSDV